MSKLKPKKQPKKLAKPATKRPSAPRYSSWHWVVLASILLAVWVAYSPTLSAEFINYDDDIYITENPIIRDLNSTNVKYIFSNYYYNQYSPVAMTIMGMEVKLFGLEARPLKAMAIVLHALNTLLVFFFVHSALGRTEYALATAALFALHPLQVESVAWLTASMKIGTFSLFTLSALLAYDQYLRRNSWGFYLLALGLFVLSCFSKEQAIALAPLLLAYDYLKKRPLASIRVWIEKIPFFAVAAIFAVVTLGVKNEMKSESLADYFSMGHRLLFGAYALLSYWKKLLIPNDLNTFYTYPEKLAIPAYYYAAPAIVLAVLVGMWYAWKHDRYILVFAGLFFFINIFLTLLSQVLSVRDVMMADRYVYLPIIGFFMALIYSVDMLANRKPALRQILWGALGVFTLVLGIATHQRCKVWLNSSTVFTDAIEKGLAEHGKINPFIALAYNNRGIDRKNRGDIQGALADYEQAIAANPFYASAYLNRANIQFNAGKYAEAIPDYNKALELNPQEAKAWSSRGGAKAALGQIEDALKDLDKALELEPNYRDALSNRALVRFNAKQYQGTIEDTDAFLRLRSDNADIINLKAMALMELGKLPEAEQTFSQAIQINPQQGIFYLNRSFLYSRMGNKGKALDDALKAKQLGAAVNEAYLESLR